MNMTILYFRILDFFAEQQAGDVLLDGTKDDELPVPGLTEVEHQVLRYIRQNPGKSRTQLASDLNLSKAMLTKAVANFDKAGLIQEERSQQENGERGKPPVFLSVRSSAFHSIGIYAHRHLCAVVRTDLSGKVHYSSLREMPQEGAVETIIFEVARAMENSPSPIIGIGHAVPAIVGEGGELFEVTPTQVGLPLVDIAKGLRSRFKLPVYWENDAFCSAAYMANGAYAAKRCVFYTTFGFGVGGGAVVKGEVFRGAFNQAANIGALIPETGPRPSLTDLARHLGCELETLSLEHLSALYAERDGKLLDWIADRGPRLSEPFSAAIQFFNPDAIVVGGFLPREILSALCAEVTLTGYDISGRRPLTKPVLEVAGLVGPLATAEAASFLPVAQNLLGQKALIAAPD
ncbi:Sugar kinase of the NBD/HSP70 family, may contain an N-terminal HTH domain [Roseibium suaedae]|uniref:Sugar kinase of the NBD/HSP70 family, may contain an N-terminal HTH domain n=1 Tax=Roseibium suaedae TaxID=735517 RepID=A0A1M7NXT9_9HYPH|nr:Sugar kinase of the NBD/HSP70 family, may contain an N-terminal HTH domain [Roseibium suaedae]